jgi:hypothetical protein
MKIHYKIVEVHPSDHLIVARYWTDVLSEQFLSSNQGVRDDGTPWRCRSDVSITLPIPTPIGEDLEDIIMKNAPSYWLKTLEDVHNESIDTSMSAIQELAGQTFSKQIDLNDSTGDVVREVLSDEEIQNLIKKFSSEKK